MGIVDMEITQFPSSVDNVFVGVCQDSIQVTEKMGIHMGVIDHGCFTRMQVCNMLILISTQRATVTGFLALQHLSHSLLRWWASNVMQLCNNWRCGLQFTALKHPNGSCRGHPWCHATCLVPRLYLGLY